MYVGFTINAFGVVAARGQPFERPPQLDVLREAQMILCAMINLELAKVRVFTPGRDQRHGVRRGAPFRDHVQLAFVTAIRRPSRRIPNFVRSGRALRTLMDALQW
jgi:hypothetical protein